MHSQGSCGCWQLCSGELVESQVQQGLCSAQRAPGLPYTPRKYQCPDSLQSLRSRKIKLVTLSIRAPRLDRPRLFSVQEYPNKRKRWIEFSPVPYLLNLQCRKAPNLCVLFSNLFRSRGAVLITSTLMIFPKILQ